MAKSVRRFPELVFKKPVLKDPLKMIPNDILKTLPEDLITTWSKPANLLLLTAWVDWNFLISVRITNKIVAAVNSAAAAKNKSTNHGAMQDWANKLQLHVYGVLNSGGNWAASEATVLSVAAVMGDLAAQLAGSSSTECKEPQLKASFLACKAHEDCRATSSVGGGNWCTFDWF